MTETVQVHEPRATYVIALDLNTRKLKKFVKSYTACYPVIEELLLRHGFVKEQGTLYVGRNRTFADLTAATDALLSLDWFLPAKKSFRAFKAEAEWTLDDLMHATGDRPVSS